ncbi:MAG: carbohydrate-binding protein [Pseudopedobacter saltans]|uniref:alpha-L-fucosidase n=1 Tax=Pseudopedobacter saltans TaxID=151895 RepID=A0A2W5EU23_9SPHI|nr:MAG: carbohydrate-binding protein [Pseudopedobacter saltans]
MTKVFRVFLIAMLCFMQKANAQKVFSNELLKEQQLNFVNLGFGMFIHYGMPTFMDQDWSDPDAPLDLFKSVNFNPDQWAKAAKSANMTYGCLTTKHHSGFPIWDTKTTSYNVMNTPLHKDVVKEFVNAFRKNGLHVMLYYSILDMHNGIRPHSITQEKIEMIKQQLTELLTNYGDIDALVIDGWDAPWSRISYDDVPFNDIYYLIKSLQPKCLVMDLNSAKYPGDALFYTDIKSYEQGAGQFISKERNKLPAMACLPLQQNWFWKKSFPTTPVKTVQDLVQKFIMPYNDAYCNFMLNVAPNANGLIDQNALDALKEIGKIYNKKSPYTELPKYEAPIVAQNISKHVLSHSSWSDDMNIMDFANDDDFGSAWSANTKTSGDIWYEINFEREKSFNCIVVTGNNSYKGNYSISYFKDGKWLLLNAVPSKQGRITIFRFETSIGQKIKLNMEKGKGNVALYEVGAYEERR